MKKISIALWAITSVYALNAADSIFVAQLQQLAARAFAQQVNDRFPQMIKNLKSGKSFQDAIQPINQFITAKVAIGLPQVRYITQELYELNKAEILQLLLKKPLHTLDQEDIQYFTFDPTGTYLAAISYEGLLNVWDTKTYNKVYTGEFAPVDIFAGVGKSLIFNAAGNKLFIEQTRQIHAVNIPAGTSETLMQLEEPEQPPLQEEEEEPEPTEFYEGTEFNEKYNLLAALVHHSENNHDVIIFDITKNEIIRTINAIGGEFQSFIFIRDKLFVAFPDNRLVEYTLPTFTEREIFKSDNAIDILESTPDGNTLAIAQNQGNIILWDIARAKQIRTIPGTGNSFELLSFNADGTKLAAVYEPLPEPLPDPLPEPLPEQTITIFDLTTQKQYVLAGNEGLVTDVDFNKDSTYLVSASEDETLRVWDLGTYTSVATISGHHPEARSVEFQPLPSGTYYDIFTCIGMMEPLNQIRLWFLPKSTYFNFTQVLYLVAAAKAIDEKNFDTKQERRIYISKLLESTVLSTFMQPLQTNLRSYLIELKQPLQVRQLRRVRSMPKIQM